MSVLEDIPLLRLDSWAPRVRDSVNEFLNMYGNRSEKYDPDSYVVTDFDNTTCIFDIENQALVYQLETMDFAITPEDFRKALARNLPEGKMDILDDAMDAYGHLYEKYGPFDNPPSEKILSEILSDGLWREFAAKMLHLADCVTYYDWKVRWLAGHTHEQIYDMCIRSLTKYSTVETFEQVFESPSDIPSRAGQIRTVFINGLTVTENTKELWKVLKENGFGIWVCSASQIDQVKAAIDFFGLRDHCEGIVAKTMKSDECGRMIPEYDFDGRAWVPAGNGWKEGETPVNGTCAEKGKVDAILNVIAPMHHGKGPMAGFVDSTGDFDFCTEFASLKLVVCINRADRSVTDGGALIAAAACIQAGSELKDCDDRGETLYVLQGRSVKVMRSFVPSERSFVLGLEEPILFKNESNHAMLAYMAEKKLSVSEAFSLFAVRKRSDDADNVLGFNYGFMDVYPGYHSIGQ